MSPYNCLPSWLGRQLHVNDGGDMASVGLTVALLVRLARALPGGPARVLRGVQASPTRILPGFLWVSSVRMATFLSSFDLDYSLSSRRSACHHRGASRALSNAFVECWWARGWLARLAWVSRPGKGPCRGNLLCPSDLCGLGPCPCFALFAPCYVLLSQFIKAYIPTPRCLH